MQNRPTSIMLFAAGFGTRMGVLTSETPKPLLPVSGVPLLKRTLDIIQDSGITRTVINTHYLPDQIRSFLTPYNVRISHENDAILETGGGLRKALPLLKSNPVFTINPDVVWHGANPLGVLEKQWDGNKMDGLLLLIPKKRARSYKGNGDFSVVENRLIVRGKEYVYSGAQIIKTDLLKDIPETAFSLNVLWNKMIAQKTLFGAVYSGDWCDVGSPDGIQLAEDMLAETPNV